MEVYFLQGVLQLILERLRMLCKLDSAAFGQLSGKGADRKGTASRQAETWDTADKALKTLMPTHKGSRSNRSPCMLLNSSILKRDTLFCFGHSVKSTVPLFSSLRFQSSQLEVLNYPNHTEVIVCCCCFLNQSFR